MKPDYKRPHRRWGVVQGPRIKPAPSHLDGPYVRDLRPSEIEAIFEAAKVRARWEKRQEDQSRVDSHG